MTKYSTGFFYPFFLIIRAGAYEHLTEEELEKILQKVARTAVEELEREAEQQPVELSETERKSLQQKRKERLTRRSYGE